MSVERMQRAIDLPRPLRAPERHPATLVPVNRAELRERRVVLPEEAGLAPQAYRMLRTQVLQRVRQLGIHMLGVVSAIDGEGKTLTAVNLALGIAAESNQNVLLLDLDLRRPAVASTLGLPVQQGLEAWFAGIATLGDVCWGIEGIERFEVMPTLSPVRGSSELLANRRTQEMLVELKTAQREGLVIVDLPPMLLTDDFLTVAPVLDGVIYVASEGITRREDVTRAREMIGSLKLIGTVLNRASESEKRAY